MKISPGGKIYQYCDGADLIQHDLDAFTHSHGSPIFFKNKVIAIHQGLDEIVADTIEDDFVVEDAEIIE